MRQQAGTSVPAVMSPLTASGSPSFSLFEHSDDGFIVIDTEQVIVFCNTHAARLFDHRPKEIVGRNISTFLPNAPNGQYRDAGQRTVTGITSRGHEIAVEIAFMTLPTGTGAPYVVAVIKDASDAARKALAERISGRLLTRVLESANAGTWTADFRSKQHFWDDHFYRLFDLHRGSVVPNLMTMVRRVHPQDRRHVYTAITAALQHHRETGGDFRLLRDDGSSRWVTGKIFIDTDGFGRPTQAVGFIMDIHDRKMYAERLQQSLTASKSGIWEHDFRAGTDYWDDNVYALLGYYPDEVPPTPDSALARMLPQDREGVRSSLDRMVNSTDSISELTYRIVLPNGTTRWIKDVTHITRDEDNRPLKLFGTIRDVTDKMEVEQRLQKTLNASRAGAWEFDFRTGDGYWSDEDYQLYGYRRGEVAPTFDAILNRVHPDDREEFLRVTSENIRSSDDIELSYRIVLPDGTVRWITDFGTIERDAHGAPVRMSGIAVDVTGIKASQLALQSIYEKLPDGIIIANASGRFLETNGLIRTMTGYSAEELRNMTVRDLHPPSDLDWITRRFDDLLARRISVALDVPVRRKDGAIIHVDITTNTVEYEGSECLIGFFRDASDRLAYERALRESKEQYERIVQTAQEGIWVIDNDGVTTFSNRRMAEMLETTTEEMLGRSFLDYMDDEGRRVASENDERRRRGVMGHHDYKFITRTGRVVWVIISTSPLTDATGAAIGSLGMVTDVTARRESERAVAAAEAKFSAIYKTMPGEIVIVRQSDRVVIDANDLFFSARNIARSSLGSATLVDLGVLTAEQSDRVSETIRTAGRLEGMEVTSATPEGTRVAMVYTEKISLAGEPHLLSISFDVTDRRREIEQRLESEMRFRLITETINEVFWMADPAIDRMIYISPGYERVWGRTVESLYENPASLVDAIYEEDRERVIGVLKRQTEGITFDHKYRIVKPDGSVRWVRDQGFPVRTDSGQLVYYVGSAQDITEQKIYDEQLLRNQRMESLGTIASGIAHDLNNILSPIMTGVSVLKHKVKDPATRPFIDTMERSANRGAEIIKQILTFARGVGSEQVAVSPKTVLKDLENMVLQTFPKNIQVKTQMETNLWRIYADPTQITQVIMNLAVNGRDAMPHGGTLELSAKNVSVSDRESALIPESRPGNYVQFTVRDTGTGIPEEIRNKVFDPFFTTKEVGKGTGLGLFSALSIVKNHGGFMTLTSRSGAGTTFSFHIPADVQSSAQAPELTPQPFTALYGHGETVLIIDDEKSIRDMVESTLLTFGYTVHYAPDGAEALAQYGKTMSSIDLVLCDISMPVLDGPATVRVIKEINPRMKVIMMTGLRTRSKEAELRDLGIITLIDKPFTAEVLLNEIHRALDH